VFGGAPNAVELPENILDAVVSWACVSSPMTTSQFMNPNPYCKSSSLRTQRKHREH
jgi:hypothetical protein